METTTTFIETGVSPNQSKYWHYRCNNLDLEMFTFLCELECEYINIGEVETGEVEKGDHFHCAIKFKDSLTEGQVKKKLKLTKNYNVNFSYYLSAKYTNSSPTAFVEYCIKNGSRFETGTLEVGKKNKLPPNTDDDNKLKNKNTIELYKKRIAMAIQNDWEWFQEHDPKWTLSAEYSKLYAKYFRAGTGIKSIQGRLRHYWVYGKSGKGKSASIEYLYPQRYKKIMSNEKWDGYDPNYDGHKVVHIDELNSFRSLEKGMEGLDGLKCKVDRNPFSVRKNYGVDIISIRPESFIITSNYTPSELLCKVEEKGFNVEMEASCLNRKFRVIHVDEWLRINRLKCLDDYGIFDMTIPSDVERYNMVLEDKARYNDDDDEFLR